MRVVDVGNSYENGKISQRLNHVRKRLRENYFQYAKHCILNNRTQCITYIWQQREFYPTTYAITRKTEDTHNDCINFSRQCEINRKILWRITRSAESKIIHLDFQWNLGGRLLEKNRPTYPLRRGRYASKACSDKQHMKKQEKNLNSSLSYGNSQV